MAALNRTNVELKLANYFYFLQVIHISQSYQCGIETLDKPFLADLECALNRTNVELKLHFAINQRMQDEPLNRTNVELKRRYVDGAVAGGRLSIVPMWN